MRAAALWRASLQGHSRVEVISCGVLFSRLFSEGSRDAVAILVITTLAADASIAINKVGTATEVDLTNHALDNSGSNSTALAAGDILQLSFDLGYGTPDDVS